MKTLQSIFNALGRLCTSKGFIHALAALQVRENVVSHDGHLTAHDLLKHVGPDRLIRTELTTLIGLLMREPIDFSLPSPQTLSTYIQQSDSLLGQLHEAMPPADPRTLVESASDPTAANPFASGELLQEAIFYAAESAYPFQYRDLTLRKYGADSDWLWAHRQLDIEVAADLCRGLATMLNAALTRLPERLKGLPIEEWTPLPAFVFSCSDLAARIHHPLSKVTSFVDAFTLPEGERNASFTSLHSFNAAYAYPFIRKGPDEYVLLQYVGLVEALYETPFYWMCDDDDYVDTALRNRGDYVEALAAERLATVFGRHRVFRNVELRRSKKETLGEIDVLVAFGNRLIVLQAKSKKLTLEARKGSDQHLQDDFKKAVQDAVDQSLSCACLLLDPSVTLQSSDGSPIELDEPPSAVFPITLLADHYPALAFQALQLLRAGTTEQIVAPITTDVFALDAMTEMLTSPLRFLSYLTLRARFSEKLVPDHELDLLAYHLRQNLWLARDVDLMRIEGDSDLYVAMAVRRDGIPGSDTPDGILTRFEGTHFSEVLAQIDSEPATAAVELGLLLLELAEDTVHLFNEGVEETRRRAEEDNLTHRFTIPMPAAATGLTVHWRGAGEDKAEELLLKDCRRYAGPGQSWFGLALAPDGSVEFVGKLVRDPE